MEGRVVHILGSPQLVLSEPWGCHTSPAEIGKEPADCYRDQTCPSCPCCLPRGTPGSGPGTLALNPRVNELPVHGGSQSLSHAHFALSTSFVAHIFSRVTMMVVFKGSERTGGTPRVKPPEEKRITACLSAWDSPLGPFVLAEWTALGMITEEDL